ncbi:MAG TPA: SAM hydroxide adenosyltransferase, partial [archaeon]|nr:SAM hydroxide adenosyltransferase [archaeon]
SADLLQRIKITDGASLKINVGEKRTVLKLSSAYDEVPTQTPLAIIGSSNFLEISVNQGNAAEKFRAKVGDAVKITIPVMSH